MKTLYQIYESILISEKELPSEYSPKIKGTAYKVFKFKNGKLYPPMVANPGGVDTPIGKWLEAEEGEFAGLSKTGRKKVKSTGSGSLAYRPGWHLGDIPRAKQFDRKNKETGEMEFPKDFVWAECDYVMDVDYQKDAEDYGYIRTKLGPDGNPIEYRSKKYQHSFAGLPRIPKGGYYKYRTNPRPDTVPWVIAGAIKVNRLLDDFEVNEILEENGIEPIHRQDGDKTLEELGLKNIDESKDRLIDRIPELDAHQKDEMKNFFKKHPEAEKKIEWNNPENIEWEDFQEIVDEYVEPIDPDTVPELSDKKYEGNGIFSYEILDDLPGQIALREIVNTHWGKDANPWCIIKGDGEGGLTDSAWGYWQNYSALPKRVAFKNGKLFAMMATEKLNSEFDYTEAEAQERFPERYEEFSSWRETEEGQEEMADFYSWMSVNYPDELESGMVQEQWWDRNNVPHKTLFSIKS